MQKQTLFGLAAAGMAAGLAVFVTLGAVPPVQAAAGCERVAEDGALWLSEENGYCIDNVAFGDGVVLKNVLGTLSIQRLLGGQHMVEDEHPEVRITSGSCTLRDNGIRGLTISGGDCAFTATVKKGQPDSYVIEGKYVRSGVIPVSVRGGAFGGATAPAAAPTPASCAPKTISRASSAHTWLRFNLPKGTARQEIRIPGGARNKYVFPTCHRVVWGDHLYRCSNAGQWTLISGDAHADILCHGSVPNSPYIQTGEK